MAKKASNYEEELANILNGLAESIVEMSDEEILAEIRENGEDAEKAAERVRKILQAAVRAYQPRHPDAAQRKKRT